MSDKTKPRRAEDVNRQSKVEGAMPDDDTGTSRKESSAA
jgi:hypothetical protein